MRRTSLALIGVVLSLAGTASARPDATPPGPGTVGVTSIFVSGRGWGHGVGMSQYGALGFANEGRGHEEILAHFYPGTELGAAPVRRVRVLLREGANSVTLSSPVPFRVRDVFGRTHPLDAGTVRLGPGLEVLLEGIRTPLAGPLVFLPGSKPLVLDTPYRGQLEVAVTGRRLSVVNSVGLEHYLAGVVPEEMPPSWHPEALQAQAVAARSYALAHRLTGKGYDLYADVRSQVYGGVGAEDARATAAVQATAGRVLYYRGRIADTLFHSTSGGRTIAASEAFGAEVPYLVGVDDPYSELSPVHRWGPVAVGDSLLRRGLGARGSVVGLRLEAAPSGRVRTARVTTTAGELSVTGTAFRRGLELRSTWITSLATLTLTRPAEPALYGRPVTLRGTAAGAKGLALAQHVGGVWRSAPARRVGTALELTTRLRSPASFRLSAGRLEGPVLRVPVAPRIRVVREPGALAGAIVPPLPGARVEVQRLEGTAWTTVGRTEVDAAGGYRAAVDLVPGTYRVRTAASGGLVAGTSAAVEIAG